MDLGRHSVYAHFPKDQNCEICQRTKITRAPCTRRIGGALLRAENLGDLITADHKVLSEGCEISKQSSICRRGTGFGHPMDTFLSVQLEKLLKRRKGACKSSWSRRPSLKSFTLTIPWDLAKPVKIFLGIIAFLHRSETNGIAERAVCRMKEGTSAVLLQSGLDENWWAESMECCCCLPKVQDLLTHRSFRSEQLLNIILFL